MTPATTTKTSAAPALAVVPTRHLNFEIAKAQDDVPLTFTLGDEVFKCLPDIPGIYLAEFVAAAEAEFGLRMQVALAFIRGALDPSEEARFDRVIRSKTVIIPMKTLAELAAGLVGEYAARPTSPPGD